MSINKKRAFTVNEKLTIINEIESGCSQVKICSEMKLKKSTVSNIWKHREKIKNDWKINAKKKKMRSSSRPKVDEMLYKWYQQEKSNNISISGTMLQTKAEEFGKTLGDHFKCSAGWLDRFKKRHDILFDKACGKSASVDKFIVNDWISQIWPIISNGYSEENIFNADETGIFFRVTPDITHTIKGEKCNDGEFSKERITALVCANASGTEKRKLLIIGKFQKPRCLCNIKQLPADYVGNEKSWMTAAIFEDYLRKWDNELMQQNRKILLLVDNCPAHPDISLHNIKLEFFPPTVTLVLQPLNQGVICSLKQSYRKQMLLRIAELHENDENKVVSLLDAINLLSFAWEKVSSETIRNCFQHSGLLKSRNDVKDASLDAEEQLSCLFDVKKFDDYVNVDNEVINTEELSEFNAMHEVIIKEENMDEDNDDDDKELETIVTTEEALLCIRRVRHYFQQEGTTDDIFSDLNKIQLTIQNDYIKNHNVQTKLTDFFNT